MVIGTFNFFRHVVQSDHHVLINSFKFLVRYFPVCCEIFRIDVAQHETEGVSDLAVLIGNLFQVGITDSHISLEIFGSCPES